VRDPRQRPGAAIGSPGVLSDPAVRRVLFFSAAYTLAASAVTLRGGNYEFILYVFVMVMAGLAIGIMHRRVGLSVAALWCLSVWGLLHMAGGLVKVPASWPVNGPNHVLYSWWLIPDYLKYDHVVHAFGFGVVTWIAWQGLRAIAGGRLRPTFGTLLVCVAVGMGFGALNEVIEFAATLLVPETNVGGYRNTGWDMVSNLVGTVAAALGIRIAEGS
jgi:uncharacterized membrane protein